METKAKFNVILSSEASDFLEGLNSKIREKIIYNIRKSTYTIDPELFKKLDVQIYENLEQDIIMLNTAC